MSAFIVDIEHLHVLVHAGLPERGETLHWPTETPATPYNGIIETTSGERYRQLSRTNADNVGQMLLDQNAASMDARYETESLFAYGYTRPKHEWLTVDVLRAIACYEYQACETADWATCEAQAYCMTLSKRLISKLPGAEDAPWEITGESIPMHLQRAAERRR